MSAERQNIGGGFLTSQHNDPNLRVSAFGDWNSDGLTDICLQDVTTGQTFFWFLDGINVLGMHATSARTTPAWRVRNEFNQE